MKKVLRTMCSIKNHGCDSIFSTANDLFYQGNVALRGEPKERNGETY